MYEQHFGFRVAPFSIAPDPSFLYLSGAHREALAHLLYGFSHGGFVMLTGEVGTGKTTLLRNLIKQTPPDLDVAFILNPRLTVRELLATLCDELGIAYDPDTTNSVKQYVDRITRHLLETHRRGRSTVMIIDEAQNLSPAVLEQVRLLTNLETDEKKLLRIILIGQPELKDMLERPELRQLAQRITARYHLGSLNRQETDAYVRHRLKRAGGNPDLFSRGALRRLYALSRGTPRLINVIADRALLGAYTEGRDRVSGRIVNRAAREVLGQHPRRHLIWLVAASAALVAGTGLVLFVPTGTEISRPTLALPKAEPTPTLAESVDTGIPSAGPPDRAPEPAAAAPVPPTPAAGVSSPARPEPTPIEPTDDAVEPEALIITPATYGRMLAARNGTPQPGMEETSSRSSASAGSIPRPPGNTYVNQRLAYAAVFDAWDIRYGATNADPIPCDFAPMAGLQCYSSQGDWRELVELDLPVVVELQDETASPFYAALLATDGSRLTLHVGQQTLSVERAVLEAQWTGRYVVLWKMPPGYYGSLREGHVHPTVAWLRAQLGNLVEVPTTSPTPDVFDAVLTRAVTTFQRAEGLTPDGVVGPRTWIRLAKRLDLPQPTLRG